MYILSDAYGSFVDMERCGKTDVLDPETGRPLCKLHGEPMAWNKRPQQKSGGNWTCLANKRVSALAYYYRHPEKYAANLRKWRKRNPDRARQLRQEWRRENPEKVFISEVRSSIKRKRQQLEEAGSVSSGSKTG